VNNVELVVTVQLVDNAGNELEQYFTVDGEAAHSLRMVEVGDTFGMGLSDGHYSFFVWKIEKFSSYIIYAECITRDSDE
jgi:hypothetical protein